MKRFWPSMPARLVLLGILVLGVLAAAAVQRQVDRQRDQTLEKRSGEVALALTTGLSESRSALRLLANVPVTPPGSPELFEQATASLLVGNTRLVALLDTTGAAPVVDAAVGEGLARGDGLTGARLALVRRAVGSDDVVTAVLGGDDTRLGIAYAGADGRHVVLRESLIDPSTPVQSVRNQPFSDIDLALYAAPTPDPDALVLRSATVPSGEGAFEQRLSFGADQWLMVTDGRGGLLSTYSRIAPWATFLAALVVGGLLAALVETLVRRRSYALALVEGRTAELEQALEDQRRLEAVANDANRTKSEFLSRMSHELRTPLNAVLGFAQLLETEPLEPEQLDSVHQIRRGGRHLLDLINEVLDLTRIETGTIALSPEAVPVGDVVAEAIELLGALAASSNVHLVGDTAHTCDVHVFADRQRLKQILLNLLSNAIKYNRPGGTVSAHCAAAGDRLRIKVVDTGPGISEADAARLFQPFERLGAEHTEVQGTGIGLALSRRLAVAMGGSVDVESVVGRGSTFWVELPIVEGPVQRYERLDVRRASASADDDRDTRTVLYIEDNVSNLRLVERVLEKRPQIHLVAAMQGRLGLDLARQHRPFAILLDLHLPDCEGEDVLHQLRDDPATASIPVVILSADATPGRIQRLVAAGAHAYLAKPLDVRRLLETLDDLLVSAT